MKILSIYRTLVGKLERKKENYKRFAGNSEDNKEIKRKK
jgi:hypothetical protein